MKLSIHPGAAFGLTSALLFGASTPLAKLLLDQTEPWLLAGLLYLGSGGGLFLFRALSQARRRTELEAPLRRHDLRWLVGAILTGGVIAPVLLMIGLTSSPASSTSLLLNLEGVATMAIAWIAFRENVNRRIFIGAVAILLGALLLSFQNSVISFGIGAIAIAGACLCWGIDNNLTRKVSGSDPLQIAMLKGLVAGVVNLTLAFSMGASLPSISITVFAMVLGVFGYGVSLIFFVLALRHVGTARTGAYFSMAPFVGAVLGIVLLQEPITANLIVAALLMGVGLYLHLVEHHEHLHVHEEMEHEHAHSHDSHHQHEHSPDDPPGEPHTHVHRHARLVHAHPHFPDLHHRHRHHRADEASRTE